MEIGLKVGLPIVGTILAGVMLFFSINGIKKSRAIKKRIEREIAEEDATAREIERLMIPEKELQPVSRSPTNCDRPESRGSMISSLSEDIAHVSLEEDVSLLGTSEYTRHRD
ncbi:hypothetical protein F4821DRAFT_168945 [Hypoxylon rubiginosum]|uniref:Uncharacterized protein n=1 Tax=Hypoxylon rubiginosum TaxID=110542 RepID=A0ACC0CWY0_9PEZI|nr:hypothetical protein F4821DRAFT_168945 [Hypoxylon rubiginosum]